MRALWRIAGIYVLIGTLSPTTVGAQCLPVSALQQEANATLVFSGVATDVTRLSIGEKLTFQVDRVWKGTVQKQTMLFRVANSESLRLSVGARYLIFTHTASDYVQARYKELGIDPSAVVSIGGCDSAPFENAERRGFINDLGPSRPPE
jgi:hypothetical protein